MHSFRAKIFVCMLLVPLLAHAVGELLETTLSDPRPQGERTLSMIMPGMASLTAAAIRHGGQDDVAHALERTRGILTLLPAAADCRDLRHHGVAIPLPGTPGLCLGGAAPPRPPLLGVVPASWSFLMPALGLLCSAFVSFFLARYLAGPILRTRAAAAAFAAGDLTARAAIAPRLAWRRRDEAADLEREFNRMADQVAALIDTQQRFIGDVSHEIRSPLGRLALTVGLIRRETRTRPCCPDWSGWNTSSTPSRAWCANCWSSPRCKAASGRRAMN